MAENKMNIESTGAEESAPYVLREIKAPDVFQMVRVLSKIGLSNISTSLDTETIKTARFKPPVKMDGNKEVPIPTEMWTESTHRAHDRALVAQSQLTVQLISLVLQNFPNCENELYTLLANGIGKTVNDIKDMDAVTFMQLINDYIDRDGFKDFFTQAAQLLSNSRRKIASPI